MINKILFILVIFIGGFMILSIMSSSQYQLGNIDITGYADPCDLVNKYISVNEYQSGGGIDQSSYAITGTPTTTNFAGSETILGRANDLYCYISNMGAYTDSLGKSIGVSPLILDIIRIIFVFVIAFGIFWLIYYVGSIVVNVIR